MYANLEINCESRNSENISSDEYSLIRQPLTPEEILVSVNMKVNWRISEPVVKSIDGTSDGGFNVSVQFEMMCSPCKSSDGFITASVSISTLDRYTHAHTHSHTHIHTHSNTHTHAFI